MTCVRDQYIASVRASLACFARARELAEEVAGHLDESTAHLEWRGMSHDEAVAEAINRLGSPLEIAAAFAENREPLAVPTRFTRAVGWLAMLALPAWTAAFAFMLASDLAERTRDWEAMPQDLWYAGMLAMMVGSVALLVAGLGLSRRLGGLGLTGTVCVALLSVVVLATPLAWFVPGWASVMAIALSLLSFRLRARRSGFAVYAAIAAAGPAGALTTFLAIGDAGAWSLAFGFMLVPGVAIALLGYRLVREPAIPVPSLTRI